MGARQATRSISAPLARTVLPVSARPALWAPFSSGGGRGNPQQLGRPWMEVDEGQLTRVSATHRHDGKQEEKASFPTQGLMGQEAGSFSQASEMKERKRGAPEAA